MKARRGVIDHYRAYLPVTDKTPVITLHEGDTPLIPSRYLSEIFGIDVKAYFKFEGLNPTGSFKDRGMTMAVSKAIEEGAKADSLRFDGEHLGVGRGLCRPRGHQMRGAHPRRKNRDRETRSSDHSRGAGDSDRRKF